MVTRKQNPDGPFYSLYVNGKPDASSGTDLPTQFLSGHFPILLHSDPKDVLIIGMASGITAGASLKYPIERLDVVELIRAMPKATRVFGPWNDMPEQDSRCVMIFDDARSYLSYTSQQYDIIISEPSNPWMAGTGALFTEDFYAKARNALRDDGIYLQWIQLYELSDEALASVVGSFRKSFPWVYGFQGNSADLLLLGSRKRIEPDWDRIERLVKEPKVERQLGLVNIKSLSSLLYLQRFAPTTADLIAATTDQENTDDNHYLEYQAPRDLFAGARPTLPFLLDERLYGTPALLWNQWRNTRNAQVDMRELMRTLADGRISLPEVNRAFKLAAWEALDIDVSDMKGDDWLIYHDPLSYAPLTRADEFERRGTGLMKRPAATDVLLLFDEYRPSLLTQASFSKATADRFLALTKSWLATPNLDPTVGALVEELRVDLLLAAGRREEARDLLIATSGRATGLPTRRLLERACRLGAGPDLDQVLQAFLRRGPDPVLERFIELQRNRAGNGG